MIEENEFKKLASNSRDWLIYQLLSERSKEVVTQEMGGEKEVQRLPCGNTETDLRNAHDSETNVQETIQGIVRIVTDKAVQIVVGINAAWIPKSAIKNLSSVVLEQGKPVSVDIQSWFGSKVEWKVI